MNDSVLFERKGFCISDISHFKFPFTIRPIDSLTPPTVKCGENGMVGGLEIELFCVDVDVRAMNESATVLHQRQNSETKQKKNE